MGIPSGTTLLHNIRRLVPRQLPPFHIQIFRSVFRHPSNRICTLFDITAFAGTVLCFGIPHRTNFHSSCCIPTAFT